jgi:hypothetical protein
LADLSPLADILWPPDTLEPTAAPERASAPPANGRFAGSYQDYIVLPSTLITQVVEFTEAEPAAFGSYAAMGAQGSFELRRSDTPTSSALTTWNGVTDFYYARDRNLRPVLDTLGIPIVPLKRDFLHAYERVITELGQL